MRKLNQTTNTLTCASQCCGPCSCSIWGLIFGLLGAALIMLSYLGPKVTAYFLYSGISERIIWQPNSSNETYLRFSGQGSSETASMKFYFWNITNVDEVKQGMKPNVTEVGPFCYDKHDIKYDISFDVEGRVHFNEYTYYSDQLFYGDCLNDTELITTPNLALLGILDALWKMQIPHFVKDIISNMIVEMDGDLFMERPVYELLWGYIDPVLEEIDKKFGFIYPGLKGLEYVQLVNNSTKQDTSTSYASNIMDTGLRNASNVMQYIMWNNVTEISSWNGTIEQVYGTDAHQFAPGITKDTILYVWTSELYRVAQFEFLTTTYLDGIELYRFVPSNSLFDVNPEYDETIYGLMNTTTPSAVGPSGDPSNAEGPQILVSLPYFCNADPMLSEGVNGVECEEPEQQLFLDVEPTMGTTMNAQVRLQLSTLLATHGIVKTDVLETIVPVFWTEQLGTAQEHQIQEFKQGVQFALKLIQVLQWGFLAGVMVITFSLFFWFPALYQCVVCCQSSRRKLSQCQSPEGSVPLLQREHLWKEESVPLFKFLSSYHSRGPSSVQPRTPSESEAELNISLE
eukprot:TRINITY_DN12440_c0_g1_i4.p1 TRINITY_DN12440_c0_g1~~TRINITY_DN12440_c0_g1_i4.p1  ORF type:complete len:570 (-),score=22.05 TRINITY_DN12440_c0_g1_i4:767-2476(-)